MKQKDEQRVNPPSKHQHKRFQQENRKNEYAESFKRMKNDPEQKFLSGAGIGDFLKLIEDYENLR